MSGSLPPDLEESRRLREQLWAYRLEEGIFGSTSAIERIGPKLLHGYSGSFMDQFHLNCNVLQFVFCARDWVPLLVKGTRVAYEILT
jgi:hypothetical protein